MDHYLDAAVNVVNALFGPHSGIPWWGWMFVLVALFWKVLLPEPATTVDRDEQMISQLTGGSDGSGKKKGKKKK